MAKSEKLVNSYLEMLKEYELTEKVIETLPRGYISTKNISGHTYHYLQWREGNHVLSTYVNNAVLAIIKQKIIIRKEYEELLKVLKKELKKAERTLLRNGYTEAEVAELKERK